MIYFMHCTCMRMLDHQDYGLYYIKITLFEVNYTLHTQKASVGYRVFTMSI